MTVRQVLVVTSTTTTLGAGTKGRSGGGAAAGKTKRPKPGEQQDDAGGQGDWSDLLNRKADGCDGLCAGWLNQTQVGKSVGGEGGVIQGVDDMRAEN